MIFNFIYNKQFKFSLKVFFICKNNKYNYNNYNNYTNYIYNLFN